MKDLSVIIVNYNVKHFVAQALRSVAAAMDGLEVEVFVVDNNSVDGSVGYLKREFPWVNILANRENLGFAKANNLAIRASQSRYVLLLNPDTVIEADTLRKTVAYLDAHPKSGALGVRMVNGEGHFLPESKRSLPTPAVAFYKIFGLAKLFPNSKRFGRYHLTFLDEHKTHQVEVLSGAFMMLRQSVLDEIGLLDEDYFMYGEDVDLSYRILQAGYHNVYFADTRIIHYKGESTKKGSLNYVLVFYNAMLIFVRKHFSRGQSVALTGLIRSAIYFRAGLSIAKRLIQRLLWPTVEFGVMALATWGIVAGWNALAHKTPEPWLYRTMVLGYPAVFVLYHLVLGNYRRPYQLRRLLGAIAAGGLTIVTMSFAYKAINYSRMIVGLSTTASLLLSLVNRGLANLRGSGSFFFAEPVRKRLLLVGDPPEVQRVVTLLEDAILYNATVLGVVLPSRDAADAETLQAHGLSYLGDAQQLEELVRFQQPDEIVFCNASLPTAHIIEAMSRLTRRNLAFKIVPPEADYLVGPNTILTAPALQSITLSLQNQQARLRKWVFDRAMSGALLMLYPIMFWVYRKPGHALQNLWAVVTGNRHLVGYVDGSNPDLPRLKDGVLDISYLLPERQANMAPMVEYRLDRQYAQHYSPALDFRILWRGLPQLGA